MVGIARIVGENMALGNLMGSKDVVREHSEELLARMASAEYKWLNMAKIGSRGHHRSLVDGISQGAGIWDSVTLDSVVD